MYEPMPEGVQLSTELADWVRLAVADAVIVFGRMEQEIIEISWLLSDADLQRRLKIAKLPATENFIAVLDTIEGLEPDLSLEALKTGFTRLAHDRNLIVHGAWTMANDRPWVVWHKFLEDSESVIGEFFDKVRFEHFMKKAQHILQTLRTFHNLIEGRSGVKTTAVPRA